MTPTPHDALFKATFSQPEHAAAALREVLPAAVAARIDFATLALQYLEHRRPSPADRAARGGCSRRRGRRPRRRS
ncbi:Rpn family recombination-promoting nuclease/putative transposase [Sorangium sp. So ce1389]|uniref:Rpn family recombination-promoting nuclease/putative transposase n=1 Tax=Sorangium sp. So ce1389 TaxID=3133336 RepID=UPI003F607A43